MGDVNQLAFVLQNIEQFRPPFLEVGSKNYGSTQDLRGLLGPTDYVGVDLADGPGVDRVLDLTGEFAQIDESLDGRRFNTIFCLSVLEHCGDPFAMCRNLTGLLNDGGVIYVAVPFSWAFHAYPSDYWRFTPEGVKRLLSELAFDGGMMSTDVEGELWPIDTELCRVTFSTSGAFKRGGILRAISTAWIRTVKFLHLAPWLLRYRYLFPPVIVHMIGVKNGPRATACPSTD